MSTPDHWTAYQRVKVVGRGAHGFAILCKRRKDNSLVVIKELFSTHASEAQESLNEIQVLSIVKHPNIVRYFDSFTAETKDEHEIEDESATDKESAAVNPFKGISSKSGATIPKTLYIVMEYADGNRSF